MCMFEMCSIYIILLKCNVSFYDLRMPCLFNFLAKSLKKMNKSIAIIIPHMDKHVHCLLNNFNWMYFYRYNKAFSV